MVYAWFLLDILCAEGEIMHAFTHPAGIVGVQLCLQYAMFTIRMYELHFLDLWLNMLALTHLRLSWFYCIINIAVNLFVVYTSSWKKIYNCANTNFNLLWVLATYFVRMVHRQRRGARDEGVELGLQCSKTRFVVMKMVAELKWILELDGRNGRIRILSLFYWT
jgi:hypothetical protein